jgi:hypothetical protein
MMMHTGLDHTPDVLAVIPARGGSKGIPRKNIQDLGGWPLMAYSIQAALASRLVTRVVVSTDDQEIADVARACGAEVPFLRPPELSGDKSRVNACCHYTRKRLNEEEGFKPEVMVILYPTHPFRPQGFIDQLTARCLAGYSPVYPVRRIASHGHAYVAGDTGGWRFLGSGPGQTFRPYGLFEGVRLQKPVIGAYSVEVSDPVSLMDIDDWNDLALARKIVERGLFPANSLEAA